MKVLVGVFDFVYQKRVSIPEGAIEGQALALTKVLYYTVSIPEGAIEGVG